MNKAKILELAKGFRGRNHSCQTIARERVEKALQYSYVSRKLRKRDFRETWIQQIGAGAQQYGMNYSRLINGTVASNIALNRKMLAELAVYEPYSFRAVVKHVEIIRELITTKDPVTGAWIPKSEVPPTLATPSLSSLSLSTTSISSSSSPPSSSSTTSATTKPSKSKSAKSSKEKKE